MWVDDVKRRPTPTLSQLVTRVWAGVRVFSLHRRPTLTSTLTLTPTPLILSSPLLFFPWKAMSLKLYDWYIYHKTPSKVIGTQKNRIFEFTSETLRTKRFYRH